MKDNSNKLLWALGIILSIAMIFVMFIGYKSGISRESDYIQRYKNLNELKADLTFELDVPSFIYTEDNLEISSVMGKIIEIRNENFRMKASEFIDDNADVLGIYDKLPIDNKYSVTNNINGITYYRYRFSGMQTIINWVKYNTSYGMVLDKEVSNEDVLSMLGINMEETSEYKEKTVEKLDSTWQILENSNVKFKLPEDIEVSIQEVTGEAIFYYVDEKPVLVVAYNNPNKYLELTKDSCDNMIYNGVYFMYVTPEKISEEDKGLDNYFKFILTMDTILESIGVIDIN